MTTPAQPDQGSGQAGDPSMEDILASIRRILSEEEAGPAAAAPAEPEPPVAAAKPAPPVADDVLVLDTSMMVAEPDHPQPQPVAAASRQPEPAPVAEPAPPPSTTLLAPEAAQAAAGSVNELVRRLSVERQTQVHAGGPTIEDLVRAELRPLIKAWLDEYLPPLVERLVRGEIERVIGRAAP